MPDDFSPRSDAGDRLQPAGLIQRSTLRLRRWLPEGRSLPEATWHQRHTAITRFALLQAVGVAVYAIFMHQSLSTSITGLIVVGVPALMGLLDSAGQRMRALSTTVSLMFASAAIVQYSGGETTAHFHFFVMIGVVALYQDWAAFGLCVLIVVLHHAVIGTLSPHLVYGTKQDQEEPLKWGLIHGAFILAASITHLLAWRANEQQELTDNLTGLPNRTALVEKLDYRLAASSEPISLLFLDIDNFKGINDSGGHLLGDLALLHAARNLVGSTRQTDLVARLGGDQFAVLIRGSVETAETVANRVRAALQGPMTHGGREVFVRASIGATDTEQAGTRDSSDLLRNADMAMFLAKSSGRNRVARFKPGIELVVKDHAELAGDLRTALSRNEFRVVYQPVMTTGGRVHGVEALLRWEHPVRGMVSPVDFIPIAEETGDIAEIGLWVLEQACDQVRHWQRTVPGLQDLELAVNLSPVQLRDPDLIMRVSRILHSTQLRPSRLTLEVTEGSLLADLGLANRQLGAARSLGVKVAIDDFGTGYSSLSYLSRLPADQVKIDRSFVIELTKSDSGAALVKGIIDMAAALKLETLAEGVEEQEQQDILTGLGCELFQGFYFCRPSAPADFERFALQARTSTWTEAL